MIKQLPHLCHSTISPEIEVHFFILHMSFVPGSLTGLHNVIIEWLGVSNTRKKGILYKCRYGREGIGSDMKQRETLSPGTWKLLRGAQDTEAKSDSQDSRCAGDKWSTEGGSLGMRNEKNIPATCTNGGRPEFKRCLGDHLRVSENQKSPWVLDSYVPLKSL